MLDSSKNSYDLFEILKAHSRTTSSGVLSVKWDQNDISIIMSDGKIVGVDSVSNHMSKVVLDRAGLTQAEIKSLPKGSVFLKSYQNLLTETLGLLPHELEKIQRNVENEELQKLKSFTEGSFEFELSIPDNARNFLINISPGQLILDLVQNGYRIAIHQEQIEEQPEPVVEVRKKEDSKSLVLDKKTKEPTKSDYSKNPNTKSFFRMMNYHSLTPEGTKMVYFSSGLFLALLCGWKMPVMFAELLISISELVKV